jgi:uncharacterized protein (TIRG00374 family)
VSFKETAASARAPSRRIWLSLLLGALVSGAALGLIARSVDFNQTLAVLTASDLIWFALAFVLQVAASLVSVRRWQVLLNPYPTHWRGLAQIYFAAHLLNTVLPAKLGAVARVLLAAEQEHLNVGASLGSVAIEKVLDTLLMLVLWLLLIPFAPLPDWVRDSVGASVLLVWVGVMLLASVGRFREPLLNWLARTESRLFGHESRRVSGFARGMLASLVKLGQRREALAILAWTAMMWTLGVVVNYVLFLALNISLPWSAAIFVLVVLQIGTRVPALPANLGVFHYLTILALGVYGVDESAALAYAILLHLVVFILPALIGAACALPLSARLTLLAGDSWRQTNRP